MEDLTKNDDVMSVISKIFYLFDSQAKRTLCLFFILILIGSGLELLGIGAVLPIVKLFSLPDPHGSHIVATFFIVLFILIQLFPTIGTMIALLHREQPTPLPTRILYPKIC